VIWAREETEMTWRGKMKMVSKASTVQSRKTNPALCVGEFVISYCYRQFDILR
jgi:hypothetical protein